MKNSLMISLFLLFLAACSGTKGKATDDNTETETVTEVEEYPEIMAEYSTAVEDVSITADQLFFTDGTDEFKTRITTALAEGVNFGGYAVFVEWGCGTACQGSAVINLKTGEVVPGPVAVNGYIYRADSSLLIVDPLDEYYGDSSGQEEKHYVWEDGVLKFERIVSHSP